MNSGICSLIAKPFIPWIFSYYFEAGFQVSSVGVEFSV